MNPTLTSSTTDCVQEQLVLVVDPDEPFRRITSRALSPLACRSIFVGSAPEAMEAARREPPDLILMEAALPGLSGLELCRRLERDDDLRHVPVILLSSSHDFQARLDGLNAGAVDFVLKPFLLEELRARVRTQLRMRSLQREALALQRILRERERAETMRVFSTGIGHNFNNLLTAGLGFLSLAQEEISNSSVLSYLRNIELALQRMCSLSSQLLAFTGDLAQQKRAVNIHAVLHNALAIFDPSALARGVALICDFTGTDGAAIYCDEFRLTQAILQVLSNALEESPRDHHRQIEFTAAPQDSTVCVKIRDWGRGLTQEELRRIRDPFYTTHSEVGRGLGLSMVEGIIRDLGGRLEIDSEPGHGTEVRLILPRCAVETPRSDVVGGEFEPGLSVLVAVDAPETRQAIQAVLASHRFRVRTVEDLPGLRTVLRQQGRQFHVVILDLLRSEVFGDRLIDLVRESTEAPIVHLVSTPTEAPTWRSGLQVLRKPFSAEAFLRTLRIFPQLVRYR